MASAREVVTEVTDLLSLPEVYLAVRRLMDDPDSCIADFGEVIGRDPGLTTRLLRMANSAFFGYATRIDTVTRAIGMMGTEQLHDLVLATASTRVFRGVPNDLVTMSQFWHRSVFCAILARLLAARCNVLDSERLFVAGLLHGVGHLVLYHHLPQQSSSALSVSREQHIPVHEAERRTLGFDYAEVGGELMRFWNMPPSLAEPVAHHLEPHRARNCLLETCLVHLAATLTVEAELGDTAPGRIAPVSPLAWQVTELSRDGIEPLKQEATRHVREVFRLLLGNEQPAVAVP